MKLRKLLGSALLVTSLFAASSALGQDKPAATPPAGEQPAQPTPKAEAAMVYVLMKTSKGDITLELNQEKAPITVANFLSYVDKKHYDGTIFHRIISNFMIQGGGLDAAGKEKKTDKPIRNEWQNGLKNQKYTIAMARKGGLPDGPDSATSQFFINVVDNAGLDRPQRDGAAYAVFGKVVAGFETVEKIKNVPVVPNEYGEQSKPTEVVKIDAVRRMTPEEVSAIKGGR
ncbi:MAG: peptidylprolyl isomerase [Phycisphaeraceae bacterium]|jgi:cyclophilin family peptidyl-prolyl cis-trans isomerase|nr:peptidylprolyl isomerase [Phycisphaeraceae bacterium]